jgi:hypothetical protein
VQNDDYVIDDENDVNFSHPSDAVAWYQRELAAAKAINEQMAAGWQAAIESFEAVVEKLSRCQSCNGSELTVTCDLCGTAQERKCQ